MSYVRLFCELIKHNVLITVPSVHQVVKTNVLITVPSVHQVVKTNVVITVPSVHQVVKTDGWKMDLISSTSLKQLSVMDRAYVSMIC